MNDVSTYELHIEVLDSEPTIWRRFRVPSQIGLGQLHPVLTIVMGWGGNADYRFKTDGPQGKDGRLDLQASDGRVNSLCLRDLVDRPGDSFLYTYNLALGWVHKVTLETIRDGQVKQALPCCLAGEQACPPDFCVGIWGYEEFLDRLGDPDDPDYDELWEQVGYDFDPAWFDLKSINQRLGTCSHQDTVGSANPSS